MIFRGRFRSRILILFVLVLLIFYYLDNLVTLFKDFNSQSSLDQSSSSHKSSHHDKPQEVGQKAEEELSDLDQLLQEHIQRARHNPDMNNKNPQWRQEMEDIFKMLENAEGRLHEALKESHFANNQSNDSIKNDNVQEAPPAGSSSKVHKVVFEPYDYTKGRPSDPAVLEKRETVRNMMIHAWKGYHEKAWSENEVRPISGKGHSANIFGNAKTGATIVDALDTLWIMGLTDEFNEGRKWVQESFKFNSKTDVSVFETVIRFVGGFIAAGTMSGDKMFYDKAIEIVDLLQGAFHTSSGIPMALFNPSTKGMKNWSWASGGCSILAEIGTLHLEYSELSNYSNDQKYLNSVMNIRNILQSMPRPDKLYPNYIHPKTVKWGQKHVSVGGLGDSFYEYLIKTYLYTNKEDTVALEMYKDALEGIENRLVKKSPGGLTYIGEFKSGKTTATMAHLTCFAGGMIALGSQIDPKLSDSEKHRQMKLAADVTNSCHESYDRSATKLGPESFRFDLGGDREATQSRPNDAYYILR